jgi:NAD(P)-dependent dehydrogenase (short-subunit alcohol dehydrogenase family)
MFMSYKILLTGASGGFGRLIARTLLAQDHAIAATMRDQAGRNREIASELTAQGAQVIEVNLTSDPASMRAWPRPAVRWGRSTSPSTTPASA